MTREEGFSGINAVVRAITRSTIIVYGANSLGVEEGFEGLIFGSRKLLYPVAKTYCLRETPLLGTTNKCYPIEYRKLNIDSSLITNDYSQQSIDNFKHLNLDYLGRGWWRATPVIEAAFDGRFGTIVACNLKQVF